MQESGLRFLVIRLSSIGDIVHALPAVAALGETFPRAEIDWVVEQKHAELVKGNPFIRRVIQLDTLGWRRRFDSWATIREILDGLKVLRETTYDAAIDFQTLWKSAVIARLARARERLGFAAYWMREPGAEVLYTEQVAPRNRRHVIEQNLALVERLGARAGQWQFPLPSHPEDDRKVEQRLIAIGAREFLIINPGGGWAAKRWAPENYADLIRRLGEELDWPVLLTGSPQEEELIHSILAQAGACRGRYFPSTVSQYIALARRARLFVGGDTGPLHLAAAVGTPVVGIYGPTDPARNGPFAAEDIALWNPRRVNHTRRGAGAVFITGIPVDSVLSAIHERLARAHE
jgi:lipopolysaccharide heptosyltransferase I